MILIIKQANKFNVENYDHNKAVFALTNRNHSAQGCYNVPDQQRSKKSHNAST